MKQHFFRVFFLFLSIILFSIILDFLYYQIDIDKSLSRNINTIHLKLIGAIVSYFIFHAKDILKRKNS